MPLSSSPWMAPVRHTSGPGSRPLTTSTGVPSALPSKLVLLRQASRRVEPGGTSSPSSARPGAVPAGPALAGGAGAGAAGAAAGLAAAGGVGAVAGGAGAAGGAGDLPQPASHRARPSAAARRARAGSGVGKLVIITGKASAKPVRGYVKPMRVAPHGRR